MSLHLSFGWRRHRKTSSSSSLLAQLWITLYARVGLRFSRAAEICLRNTESSYYCVDQRENTNFLQERVNCMSFRALFCVIEACGRVFRFETTVLIYFNFTPYGVSTFRMKGWKRRDIQLNLQKLQSEYLHNRAQFCGRQINNSTFDAGSIFSIGSRTALRWDKRTNFGIDSPPKWGCDRSTDQRGYTKEGIRMPPRREAFCLHFSNHW